MKHYSNAALILNTFLEKLDNDAVKAYCAYASFFLFLSFIPFVMFLLTLLNYLPFDIAVILETDFNFLSRDISNFVISIINDVYEKSSGALISITTITALWSASKGFLGIIEGLNKVYSTDEKRGYVKLRFTSLFYTLIMIVVLITTLAFLVFGGKINNWLKLHALDIETVAGFDVGIRWLIGVCILTLFFMFVYTVVPERKTRFITELPGAAVSALGWTIFSALFSLYINKFADFQYLYGNLTSIILLMLWLYSCVTILFMGAELNCVIQDKKIAKIYKNWCYERKERKDS